MTMNAFQLYADELRNEFELEFGRAPINSHELGSFALPRWRCLPECMKAEYREYATRHTHNYNKHQQQRNQSTAGKKHRFRSVWWHYNHATQQKNKVHTRTNSDEFDDEEPTDDPLELPGAVVNDASLLAGGQVALNANGDFTWNKEPTLDPVERRELVDKFVERRYSSTRVEIAHAADQRSDRSALLTSSHQSSSQKTDHSLKQRINCRKLRVKPTSKAINHSLSQRDSRSNRGKNALSFAPSHSNHHNNKRQQSSRTVCNHRPIKTNGKRKILASSRVATQYGPITYSDAVKKNRDSANQAFDSAWRQYASIVDLRQMKGTVTVSETDNCSVLIPLKTTTHSDNLPFIGATDFKYDFPEASIDSLERAIGNSSSNKGDIDQCIADLARQLKTGNEAALESVWRTIEQSARVEQLVLQPNSAPIDAMKLLAGDAIIIDI